MPPERIAIDPVHKSYINSLLSAVLHFSSDCLQLTFGERGGRGTQPATRCRGHGADVGSNYVQRRCLAGCDDAGSGLLGR